MTPVVHSPVQVASVELGPTRDQKARFAISRQNPH
jgi:hypothetical protein